MPEASGQENGKGIGQDMRKALQQTYRWYRDTTQCGVWFMVAPQWEVTIFVSSDVVWEERTLVDKVKYNLPQAQSSF